MNDLQARVKVSMAMIHVTRELFHPSHGHIHGFPEAADPSPAYAGWRRGPAFKPGAFTTLEIAVAAGSDAIVTHNVRDFGGVEKLGIRVLTPKQFLHELRGR